LVRLPVSDIEVFLRLPAGAEDLMLLESTADTYLALALVQRVAHPTDAPVEWPNLPVTDLDVLVLRLRQMVLGDLIQAEASCPVAGCGARIDVTFSLDAYLDHHQPRSARSAEPADEPGWFRLHDTSVVFRLPTVADQLAVAGLSRPTPALVRRCIRPWDAGARLVRRVENAMEALAPSLAHELEGVCPECGTAVAVYFDPRQFCLQELRDQAAYIMEDTHLLAAHYHWPEEQILALPRQRRIQYVELVRQDRSRA
jgi:hypothetical protein